MNSNKKIKLVYIMSAARSGSTILDMALSQIKGFTSVGELCFLWRRGILKNMYCGCGERFIDCCFWPNVYKGAFDKIDIDEAKEIDSLIDLRIKKQFFLNFAKGNKDTKKLVNYLENLYQNVARRTKSDVIIDSSKWPTYALLLTQIPSIELYVVDLVRDPRAVAYSWTKKKKYEPFVEGGYIKQLNGIQSAIEWSAWNVTGEVLKYRFKRSMKVKYEDFASQPEYTMTKILEFINETNQKNPVKSRKITFGKNHLIAGNPIRFKRGDIDITLDDKWRSAYNNLNKFYLTVLYIPFLLRYRYPLRFN